MSLFKILKGDSSRISTSATPFHDGYAYLTHDDGGFYIDSEKNGEQKRIKINDTPTKGDLGLGNVENKSSETIRGEITKANVTTALGYTPVTPTELAAKAPLASPALTGTPTAPTAAAGTNTTQIATTAFVKSAVGALDFTSPSASSTDISFIDTVSQTDGKIAATKKTVRSASTSQTGVVQLNNTTTSTSTSYAATANAVKLAYDKGAEALNAANNVNTDVVVYGPFEPAGNRLWFYSPSGYSFEAVGSYPWVKSDAPNPDATQYDGVYQSGNYHVSSSQSVVKINFAGYDTFTVYIRSYGESSYDYIMASTLDAASYPTSYSASTVKSHTRGSPKSGTALSDYTKVEYPNDGGEHFIYIVYCKDGSSDTEPDRGYFFIKK